MLTLLAVALPWAVATEGEAAGCDAAPPSAITRPSPAGPFVGVDGEEWRVLGQSADARARVVACRRGPGSTADTVERQWLVERVGAGPPVAVSIGERLDSSFEARFTGPVRVARSQRVPASIPAWEVCGSWESGDTGDGARAEDGCRLVVSPAVAGGMEPAEGQRVVTFIAAGEHPFLDFMAWFDIRSTWSAVAGGWRITETWTWRAPPRDVLPSGSAGPALPPLVQESDVRWNAASAAFTVTLVGPCDNRAVAISRIQPGAAPCGTTLPRP